MANQKEYDVVVIGGGPGGYVALFVRHNLACAQLSLKKNIWAVSA